ncbi:MAG: hypothetical protein HUJ25_11385 [Crocinitomicaceae bacterium]|nr:hypothetical protein [Crocinitomicaceae bacterium]
MQVIFIGKQKSYLQAYAQNIEIRDFSVYFITEEEFSEQKLLPNIDVIIADVDHCDERLEKRVNLFRSYYPNAQIWGVFNFKSAVLSNNLLKMGMTRLISKDDDITHLLEQQNITQ